MNCPGFETGVGEGDFYFLRTHLERPWDPRNLLKIAHLGFFPGRKVIGVWH
jgi:hypothetical protein